MTQRNPRFAHLSTNYLFPEINRRKQEFLLKRPSANVISLGIGDTSEPLPEVVTDAFCSEAKLLATRTGYHGYGPEQGNEKLRIAIAQHIYSNKVHPNDIFISDGAKCDIGRLQTLFGPNVTITVQDPAYPVYVDGSYIAGVNNIYFLPCNPSNHFCPDLGEIPKPDVIYWCSPNNPTGTTSTREQLQQLVNYATINKAIIVYDAAYANYIRDESLPKSIYEIEGGDKVAIELGSFSKLAGFTGVRLGWSVVPSTLLYDDGSSVRNDWKRLFSTIFNGASSLSQAGGIAALTEEGLKEIRKTTDYYLQNAAIIKDALEKLGYEYYGGDNSPYLWVKFPGMSSWEAFQYVLDTTEIVTTPGSGFGPAGEGFLRFSAFGHRENILEGANRIRRNLKHSKT